jgi:iron-sulfur cluster assembly accessory protein
VIITVTERARLKAVALRAAEGHDENAVLRVGVQGGGCSGFQYQLEFDERRDDDELIELPGVTVAIDPYSGPLIAGSTLDYDGGLGGRGFEFTNPQVEAGCGCGRSFQVNPDALDALEVVSG